MDIEKCEKHFDIAERPHADRYTDHWHACIRAEPARPQAAFRGGYFVGESVDLGEAGSAVNYIRAAPSPPQQWESGHDVPEANQKYARLSTLSAANGKQSIIHRCAWVVCVIDREKICVLTKKPVTDIMTVSLYGR